jgi:hypothetical protein
MFAETFKYPRVIVVLVENLDLTSSSPSIDSLFALGITGHAVLKTGASFAGSFLCKPDAQHVWYSPTALDFPHTPTQPDAVIAALKASSAAVQVVYLRAEPESSSEVRELISGVLETFKAEFRVYLVLYPSTFISHPPSNTPYADLFPPQSYQFQNGYDISSSVDLSKTAVYVEYEKDYTRTDWIASLAQAQSEEGGSRLILLEQLSREVAFRTGYAWKYGA